jgi:raffinose/stachyose/melibiose transport system permease protein
MNRTAVAYVCILPGLVLITVFLLVPIGYGLWLSLHMFDGLRVGRWMGLDHYRNVVLDPAFRSALAHTAIFAAITVVGKTVAGLSLASLVSLPLRGARLFRTLLFLPVTLNIIVIGAFWTYFLSAARFGGLLNQILGSVGLQGLEQSWLSEPGLALVSVSLIEVWRWSGLHMLIFLAGMQSIDPSLYAAVTLDGAGPWQRFFYVTLPQLRPVLYVSTLIALMGAFVRSFDAVWVLTRAGFGTQVSVTYLYTDAFRYGHFDRATATGYLLLAVTGAITFAYSEASRRWGRDA